MKVNESLGSRDRCWADTVCLPFYFPCHELSRDQSLPTLSAVNMLANYHRSAETVRQPADEVNLLGCDSLTICSQTHHSTTNAERAAIHELTTPDRCEELRRPF